MATHESDVLSHAHPWQSGSKLAAEAIDEAFPTCSIKGSGPDVDVRIISSRCRGLIGSIPSMVVGMNVEDCEPAGRSQSIEALSDRGIKRVVNVKRCRLGLYRWIALPNPHPPGCLW